VVVRRAVGATGPDEMMGDLEAAGRTGELGVQSVYIVVVYIVVRPVRQMVSEACT
jgi:hypothetical protein